MEKLKTSFSLFMCSVLIVSTLSLAFGDTSLAKENAPSENAIMKDGLEKLMSTDGDFVKFMEGIEELPPGIEKQGAEKVASWLTKKTKIEVTTDGENLLVPSLSNLSIQNSEQSIDSNLITTFGAADCIIAVGLLIGTVGFPLSKITKLKKAIDLLGGVKKTVDRIYKSYKKYKGWNYRTKDAWKAAVNESAKGLPKDTLDAFLDFFNIANVINACT
ncbi:hypothetical protein CW357_07135 [Rummeliibacillus sp. TYF005]|jgi:hypothetical protein|uniref:hypothetical protein n=1 Tax=unclassified Rummeliibacillus TaxID=2622809 RepID=UPI000E675018|nr:MULTISPECIES: hypothetical protein [unclassified Rummeliibacillus]RIJ63332.1 hypothetical protein D1606_15500 [Rummeliibacillus sp. POC4]RPJ96113.1 hypothetical protein CW357_07135 [Rummeliibacillus sp. TYF005]